LTQSSLSRITKIVEAMRSLCVLTTVLPGLHNEVFDLKALIPSNLGWVKQGCTGVCISSLELTSAIITESA